MGGYRWKPEEEILLDSLTEQYPFEQLCATYNRKAKELGYPERTKYSIESRLAQSLGCSRMATLDRFTASYLARELGTSTARVFYWIKTGKLKSRMWGDLHAITRVNLARFVKKNPAIAKRLDQEKLAWLLDGVDI